MESKDELKGIDINNCTCYYFSDITRVKDLDFSDILLNKKSYKTNENILIYDILCKTFMDPKPLSIRLDEIDGFIKIDDGIRYLFCFGFGLHDAIYNRIRYLLNEKKSITDILIVILQESENSFI